MSLCSSVWSDHMRSVVISLCFLLISSSWREKEPRKKRAEPALSCRVELAQDQNVNKLLNEIGLHKLRA